MKTKQQKIKEVEEGKKILSESKSLILVEFSKTPTKLIEQFRRYLANQGVFRVIKKRLLNLVFKEKEIPLDAKKAGLQVAVVFGKGDIFETAGLVWKFISEKGKEIPDFKMLAGFDLDSFRAFSEEEVRRVGQLPSREVLLAQLAAMFLAPLRSLAFVLKRVSESKKGS